MTTTFTDEQVMQIEAIRHALGITSDHDFRKWPEIRDALTAEQSKIGYVILCRKHHTGIAAHPDNLWCACNSFGDCYSGAERVEPPLPVAEIARAIYLAWMRDERWHAKHLHDPDGRPLAYFWADVAAAALSASESLRGQGQASPVDALKEAIRRTRTRLEYYCNEANAGRMPSDAREFMRRVQCGFDSLFEDAEQIATHECASSPASPVTDADMRAFGASDAACYHWPDGTAEHKALRAAYCQGAADCGPGTATPGRADEGWQLIETAPFRRTVILGQEGSDLCVSAYRSGPISGWRHAHSSDAICFVPTHWQPMPSRPDLSPPVQSVDGQDGNDWLNEYPKDTQSEAAARVLRQWADLTAIPSGSFINDDLRQCADIIDRQKTCIATLTQDIAEARAAQGTAEGEAESYITELRSLHKELAEAKKLIEQLKDELFDAQTSST